MPRKRDASADTRPIVSEEVEAACIHFVFAGTRIPPTDDRKQKVDPVLKDFVARYSATGYSHSALSINPNNRAPMRAREKRVGAGRMLPSMTWSERAVLDYWLDGLLPASAAEARSTLIRERDMVGGTSQMANPAAIVTPAAKVERQPSNGPPIASGSEPRQADPRIQLPSPSLSQIPIAHGPFSEIKRGDSVMSDLTSLSDLASVRSSAQPSSRSRRPVPKITYEEESEEEEEVEIGPDDDDFEPARSSVAEDDNEGEDEQAGEVGSELGASEDAGASGTNIHLVGDPFVALSDRAKGKQRAITASPAPSQRSISSHKSQATRSRSGTCDSCMATLVSHPSSVLDTTTAQLDDTPLQRTQPLRNASTAAVETTIADVTSEAYTPETPISAFRQPAAASSSQRAASTSAIVSKKRRAEEVLERPARAHSAGRPRESDAPAPASPPDVKRRLVEENNLPDGPERARRYLRARIPLLLCSDKILDYITDEKFCPFNMSILAGLAEKEELRADILEPLEEQLPKKGLGPLSAVLRSKLSRVLSDWDADKY